MRISVITLVLISIISLLTAGKTNAAGVVDPYGIIKKPIPDKTVVLTFDDGCLSHFDFVAPLLKEYGFGGSFYITTAFGFTTRKDWYMTWEQIKAVQDMGFEIGNHTSSHQSCSAIPLERCVSIVATMEELFAKHGIAPATTFCWPLYRIKPEFLPKLDENGYLFARSGSGALERVYDPLKDCPFSVPSFTIHDDVLKKDPQRFIRRAQEAKNGKVAVFTFHGVPDGEHASVGVEPKKFEEMVNYLKKDNYNVIAMRDVATYIDTAKAVLYLSRQPEYPWGGRALSWGWVNRIDNHLNIGIAQLPADRKLTLPNMTTKIAHAWFLADPEKKAISVKTAFNGISTITVPPFSPDIYGESPVIIAAQLQGGPVAAILDFGFPGLPEVTFSGDEIRALVPEATDLKSLAPVYRTGSSEVTGEPASGTARDFTRPQTYTITAADGTSRTYTVTVTKKLGAVGAADSSFERFASLDRHAATVGRNPEGAFWIFTQGVRNADVGIISAQSGAIEDIPPLDGSRHCGLVGGAGSSLSQSVVFDAGTYTISFDRAFLIRSAKHLFPSLQLTLDGRVLLTLESVNRKNLEKKEWKWKTVTSPPFTVTAGPHTIGFASGSDASPKPQRGDGPNIIDNVRINYQP